MICHAADVFFDKLLVVGGREASVETVWTRNEEGQKSCDLSNLPEGQTLPVILLYV